MQRNNLSSVLSFSWERLLPGAAALILAGAFASGVRLFVKNYGSWQGMALLFALLALLGLALRAWRLERIPAAIFLGGLLGLFLASRLIWVLAVPTPLVSDFLNYDIIARSYAFADPPARQLDWFRDTYSQGYPLLLAGLYRLAGHNIEAARLMNLFLGAGALLVFYSLSRRFGERAARMAALLFALWPAQLSLSSVLASEHLALLLFLAALACLFSLVEENRGLGTAAAAGGLLALAYLTRSPLVLALPAAILLIWSREPLRTALNKTAGMVGGLLAVLILVFGGMKLAFGVNPASQGYSTLLSGTNYASRGGWNPEDGLAYLDHPTKEEADQYALNTALRRIRSSPIRFAKLMVLKLPRTWHDGTYGVYWSTLGLENVSIQEKLLLSRKAFLGASQAYQLFILAVALIGALQAVISGRGRPALRLGMLIFLAVAILHSIFETQPRYSYWVMPLLILQAGIVLADGIQLSKKAIFRASARPDGG